MANIGDVTARLRADVSDYVSGMQRAQQANQQLTATVNQGSQAYRLSTQGINEAVAAYDRAMASSSGLRSSIDVLRSDVAQATADFKAGLISIQDYRVALDQARQSALAMRGSGGLNGAEISALNSVLVKTAPAAETAVAGLGRLTLASGYLASSVLGGNFILGRLLGSVTAFGISAPAVIGALAGITALGLLWKQYTDVIAEVDTKNKQATDSLAKLAEQGMNPVVQRAVQAGQSVDAFSTAVDKATLKAKVLGIIGGTLTTLGLGGLANSITGIPVSTTDANTAALAGFEGQRKVFTDGLGTTKQIMDQLTASETKARNAVVDFGDSVEVAALKERHVSPEIIREAEAHQQNTRVLQVQAEAIRLNTDVLSQMVQIGQEVSKLPAPVIDWTESWGTFRNTLETVRSPLDDVLDRANALKAFQEEAAKAQHPGGIVGPAEAADLRSLGLDPAEIQRELDKAGAPLDKAVGDLKDRFGQDMARVGHEGIRALVQGIADGTNSFLPLLRKIILDFLTSGISDLIDGLFSGGGDVGGGIVAGAGGGGGASGAGNTHGKAIRMSVNVGPSRDPMSLARDGQWQQALRESLLVARSQGFK